MLLHRPQDYSGGEVFLFDEPGSNQQWVPLRGPLRSPKGGASVLQAIFLYGAQAVVPPLSILAIDDLHLERRHDLAGRYRRAKASRSEEHMSELQSLRH